MKIMTGLNKEVNLLTRKGAYLFKVYNKDSRPEATDILLSTNKGNENLPFVAIVFRATR